MKTCNRCKQDKPFVEFHRRGSGYQPYCKICKKADDARYREANMDYFVQRAKEQKRLLLQWYNELKSAPCSDCGHTFDPVCMQWDHLPGTNKVANVSALVAVGSRPKILAEIAKCELVCANCHALRTKHRFAAA